MNKIQVKVLNPESLIEAEKMMVFCARLTQRGHGIHNMDDLLDLYNKPYKAETAKAMTNLPHPTIQKFGAINVVVVGASRRFLAQITRHQNEVKFMSASLQYSDYSGQAEFCVPASILKHGKTVVEEYERVCNNAMESYKEAIELGLDNDAAGYMAPQGLRNILVISATPYQWKHMISQRICRRNTEETRFVMLLIWKKLMDICPTMFKNAGPFCMNGGCKEGKMACGRIMRGTPEEILEEDFRGIYNAET